MHCRIHLRRAHAGKSRCGRRDAKTRSWPALQKTLDELVAERRGAGIGVGICFGDDAPEYPSAGTLAFDSRVRFDENSIGRMYSITKHVTRIATLLLVEDGKLTLDQPVTDVLPEFRNLRVVVDLAKVSNRVLPPKS